MVLKGDDRVHCVYCISEISHLIIYVSHEVSEKEIYFLCHKTQQQSSNNNILNLRRVSYTFPDRLRLGALGGTI